ncbi:MAG: rod shape-determining protein MreD [Syntrophomonadaceae bacterium]
MRYLILVLLSFLALFLQTTFFRAFTIGGIIPDLILILVVCHALFNGVYQGTIYGMLCGLLEDLYIGRFIGMNAVSKGITAYVAGRLQGNVFKENVMVGIIGVIGGTLLNFILLFILSALTFEKFNLDYSILIKLSYQLLYNTILTVPMYIWYYHSSHSGWLRETEEY